MTKLTFKLFAAVAIIFTVSNVAAQIYEYKTIDDYLSRSIYCDDVVYSCSEGYLKLYDESFTCIKTIKIDTGTHEYSTSILCLSKNAFTSTGKYEFIISNDISTKLYNEDGVILYDFGIAHGIAQFMLNKLVLSIRDISNNKYTSKIYNIQGTAAISSIKRKESSKLYPNPARQSVTLEYDIQGQMQEMQIVDMQGRVVASYLLDPSQKQVKINTSNYKKGVYIYRYGNNSGKFVVE